MTEGEGHGESGQEETHDDRLFQEVISDTATLTMNDVLTDISAEKNTRVDSIGDKIIKTLQAPQDVRPPIRFLEDHPVYFHVTPAQSTSENSSPSLAIYYREEGQTNDMFKAPFFPLNPESILRRGEHRLTDDDIAKITELTKGRPNDVNTLDRERFRIQGLLTQRIQPPDKM